MKITAIHKIEIFVSLVMLNFILRNQVFSNEIGSDSFLIHIMVNSLTEFGTARWIMNPLSYIGLYPASYTSSMQFLLSGLVQLSGLQMRDIIYLYCIVIGLLSMATSYLMAGEFIDDDLYKILTAFAFSTSPGVLGYTTWTIPTRGLLIILAPLFIFILLKSRKSLKFIPLALIFSIFLLATHHLFYFLLPAIFSFIVLTFVFHFREKFNFMTKYTYSQFLPLFTIALFGIMFSIPFFTGKFIEVSRYSPVYISYLRYVGIMLFPAIGALFFLILKKEKSFNEWFLLLTLAFLSIFIYQQTYMKWFLPIFVIPLATIGLINMLSLSRYHKNIPKVFIFILVLSLIFSSYFQYINNFDGNDFNERYLEDSVQTTGIWTKNHITEPSISNDVFFSKRVFSVAESSHMLTDSTMLNHIYGFSDVNISNYERYPINSEEFWFSGYKGRDYGLIKWESVQKMWETEEKIKYFIEDTRANGFIVWNHKLIPSPLLKHAYSYNRIYDNGISNIWTLF